MRVPRHVVPLIVVVGLSLLVSPILASACSVAVPTIKVQPTFSVHVYNELGPLEGLKLKVVVDGARHADALAAAITNEKGIAIFQLPKLLWGGGLFMMAEHKGEGWGARLDVETDATQSSIELHWPLKVLRTSKLEGYIHVTLHTISGYEARVFPLAHAQLSLRTMVAYTEIAKGATNEWGEFQFEGIEPGLYFLEVNRDFEKDWNVPSGNIAVYIGATEPVDKLQIATNWSFCGLSYRTDEKDQDHDQHKPGSGKPKQ
jgi:hypothetical protein